MSGDGQSLLGTSSALLNENSKDSGNKKGRGRGFSFKSLTSTSKRKFTSNNNSNRNRISPKTDSDNSSEKSSPEPLPSQKIKKKNLGDISSSIEKMSINSAKTELRDPGVSNPVPVARENVSSDVDSAIANPPVNSNNNRDMEFANNPIFVWSCSNVNLNLIRCNEASLPPFLVLMESTVQDKSLGKYDPLALSGIVDSVIDSPTRIFRSGKNQIKIYCNVWTEANKLVDSRELMLLGFKAFIPENNLFKKALIENSPPLNRSRKLLEILLRNLGSPFFL